VFVYDDSSPYYEEVFVNKSLFFIGENKDTVCIDGSYYNTVLHLFSDNITVKGFTIQNSYFQPGIIIDNHNNIVISDNNFEKNLKGIEISNCMIFLIDNNNFLDNDNGIYLHSCSGLITNNNFYYNRIGIVSFYDHGINISYNLFSTSNSSGIWIQEDDGKTIISYNIFMNSKSGLYLWGGQFIQVSYNLFQNNSQGIFLHGGFINLISHNNFCENKIQLVFDYYGIVNIHLNQIKHNYWKNHPYKTPKIIAGYYFVAIPVEGKPGFWTTKWVPIPWFLFDLSPAKEPYEITRMT
jgi:parallel beta-helix repeat protein